MKRAIYYVIKEKCIGCGLCILISKDLFDFDEDGKAKEKKNYVDKEKEIKILEDAKKYCPTDAIIVEEVE